MEKLNYIFIITVAIYQLSSCRANYLNSSMKGTMAGNWSFTFEMYVKYPIGLILYAIEGDNRLLITLQWETIQFTFNDKWSQINLKQLCGCGHCMDILLNFDLKRQNEKSVFSADCGTMRKESVRMDSENNEIWDDYPYPTDKSKLHLWMGNFGMDKNDKHRSVYPLKDHLFGCLEMFLFNNQPVNLSGDSKYFKINCHDQCIPKLCNKGICQGRHENRAVCDCSNTAKNGDLCNRNLTEYLYQSNNSYRVSTSKHDILLKVSWTYKTAKDFCLLDFTNGQSSNMLIHINQNKLKNGQNTICDISPSNDYFLNIIISETNVTVKMGNYKVQQTITDEIMIDVGFSRYNQCTIFSGKYDLEFNKSQIIMIQGTDVISNASSLSHKDHPNWIQSPKRFMRLIIAVYVIGFVLILLFTTINLIMRLRRRKSQTNNNTNAYLQQSDLNLDPMETANEDLVYDALDFIGEEDMHYMTIGPSNSNSLYNLSNGMEAPEPPPRRK